MHIQLEIKRLITEDLARCEELYQDLKTMRSKLPKGSLLKRGDSYYHVYWENGKQTRKVVTNSSFIEKIKLQQFLKKGLAVLEKRINASKAFLIKSSVYDPLQIFDEMPDAYNGLTEYNVFLEGDIDPVKWQSENYQRNTRDFDSIHYTNNKVPVRSKAEAMIGTQIEYRKWLYRCEPRLPFGNKIKCPDFVIIHPRTRKVIYLEHFGKMDDLKYVRDTTEKLMLYRQNGLYLGINFFFTWETRDKPLNIVDIEAVLDEIEALN